jgi:DNA-binding NarL/FixJ family response regulator
MYKSRIMKKREEGAREAEVQESLRPPRATTSGRRQAVTVNDAGYPIGQDHHRAKFSDHEIELMIELARDGMPYRLIAEKFETTKGTVHDYVSGRRRGQVATGQRVRVRR